MFEYLPTEILKEINKLKFISEIRLRVNSCPQIFTDTGIFSLSKILVTSDTLKNIVITACKRSIYGYDEFIKRGFITTDCGERIGICGEFVYSYGEIQTIKNYSSLVIRIPNDILGVSNEFFKIYNGGSVLIISKTGVGKTTFLRDLTRNLSINYKENVIVIDERNEIAVKTKTSSFYLGDSVDVLTFANKSYGFTHAVRTLNPSYVVTDELITEEDYNSVILAVKSGLNVFASMHGDENFKVKINNFLKDKIFNYYVYISKNNNERKLKVYDKNLNLIC